MDYYKLKLKNKLLGSHEQTSATDIILVMLAVLMVLVLLLVCFFQMCNVKGTSMANNLQDGDRLLITNYSVDLKFKDIIVLDQPDESEASGYIRLIKRVVATEGEQFYFSRQAGYVDIYKKNSDGNFERLIETYIKEPMKASDMFERNFSYYNPNDSDTVFTVPEGCILFLGDNRNDSKDSRYYGYAKTSDVLGKMVYKLEPNNILSFVLKLIFS